MYTDWNVDYGSRQTSLQQREFAKRGDAMYENEVRPQLEPGDKGKFAAIDIETGAYEVDRDELRAGETLCLRSAGGRFGSYASATARRIVSGGGRPKH